MFRTCIAAKAIAMRFLELSGKKANWNDIKILVIRMYSGHIYQGKLLIYLNEWLFLVSIFILDQLLRSK